MCFLTQFCRQPDKVGITIMGALALTRWTPAVLPTAPQTHTACSHLRAGAAPARPAIPWDHLSPDTFMYHSSLHLCLCFHVTSVQGPSLSAPHRKKPPSNRVILPQFFIFPWSNCFYLKYISFLLIYIAFLPVEYKLHKRRVLSALITAYFPAPRTGLAHGNYLITTEQMNEWTHEWMNTFFF